MNIKKIALWIGIILFTIILLKMIPKPEPVLITQTNSTFVYEAGEYTFLLTHDKLQREYFIHVPQSYEMSKKTPLIFAFHGGGGNIENTLAYMDLNTKSDKEGFIVVYPQGYGETFLGKKMGSWNAGECCRPSTIDNIDDVDFVKTLLKDIKEKFNIDSKKIYATGMSNGALMSYRLACDMADTFAAIAPAGAHDAYDNCTPSRPVPVIHFHGRDDHCTPYDGGECGTCFINIVEEITGIPLEEHPWNCSSVPEYIKKWSEINKCSQKTQIIYEKNETQCIRYTQCKDGADIILCTIADMGHSWPGNIDYIVEACKKNPQGRICNIWNEGIGPLSDDLSANDMMWDFFEKHPMK